MPWPHAPLDVSAGRRLFFYKRARRRVALYGTADEHRERIAALTIG